MEENNPNGNKIPTWLVIAGSVVLSASELTRKLLRSKHQKDLQKRVDDSQPSPCDINVSVDNSLLPIYVVGKDEVDLSKYEEITIDSDEAEEWKNIISTFGSEILKAGMTSNAFNGLLKCDVPLKDLYRIKDAPNSMRGFVMKDGKFDKQAKFSEANISNIAPLMIYQCLAAVTSQYYQHIISERLSEIDYKLDNLMQVLYADDYAKLKGAYDGLVGLSKKESYDITDKMSVLVLFKDVRIVRDKYVKLLEEITIEKLHVDYKWTDKREAESKIQQLKKTQYFERLEMVRQAEYLVYLASVVSIKVAKYLGNDEDVKIYADRIKFNDWDKCVNQFQIIRHDITQYLDLESETSWFQGGKIKKMKDEQEMLFSSYKEKMVDLQTILDYRVIQYVQIEEDGSMKKFISLKKE